MIRVLIVEDDPMVAEINKRYLESVPGFHCIGVASSAFDAVSLMDRERVDLVLLDIFMPVQSGLELLTQIRHRYMGVDVIVISAASEIHHIQSALRLGVVDYLIKPFEFERFQSALQIYQHEQAVMSNRETFSQAELDRLILHQEKTDVAQIEIPKGLTRATLKRVVEHILVNPNADFSTEALAQKVGISRVSMRKYLSFLDDINLLSCDIDYRTLGRPVYKYRVNHANIEHLKTYLSGPTQR